MRHRKKFNHLGRKKAHRKALLTNLSVALITNKRIFTTLAKAKALRPFIEPLITRAKDNTQHNRRVVFSYLQNKEATTELFEVVAPKVADRPGGYTRVIKTGFRKGDGAETAMIELVDFNEIMLSTKGDSAGKKRTRRRGKKKTGSTVPPVATQSSAKSEEEE